MRKDIYISSSKEKDSKGVLCNRKRFLFSSVILFPVMLVSLLYIFERDSFISSIKYVFSDKEIVKYDTYSLSIDESIPDSISSQIWNNLDALEFEGRRRFEAEDKNYDLKITFEEENSTEEVFKLDYIPAVHIYSTMHEIREDQITDLEYFILDDMYVEYLEEEFNISIQVVDSYELLIEKLEEDYNNVALLTYDEISFDTKVLELNEEYYFDNEDGGSFNVSFNIVNEAEVNQRIIQVLKKNIGLEDSNFDINKLVKINMGGVVALTRALGSKIDASGDWGYPASEIGEYLADADLTHVSNEVSFVPNCTNVSGMRFCSKPEYMEVLEDSGVDIVELTGNHNNDYGSQYSKSSIEMYKDLGMNYFGGGLNQEDASEILYEDVDGVNVAFVGYNYYDTMLGTLALAGNERSGANSYSEEKVESDMEEAKDSADLVIVTFQFQECYCYPDGDVIYPPCYKPLSTPDQEGVFKHAIDSGADIVIGTQAHQPQTYEMYQDGIIFYGLGNLFFDQSIWIGTRQGLVLSHYLYDGEYIQTRIMPIYMEKDLIPRIATDEQRDLLLELLQEAR